ncbi:hypothetical protein IWX90DRAFT_490485 [Phyllosticta citrichinensis]|uniref:Uncharacterized protein n=1 Tax=Phyllosticta citrichinensis TaxID=1130410 RepID=A0ABR1XFV0_9PEZI
MRFSTFASTAAVFAVRTHAAASWSYASPSAYTPYINFNTVAYITETVSAYTTYFSVVTQLALPDTTYTITEPTTLTLTNGGPFTVVRPLVAQTIVAGCATCYATAPFATPSLDANGTSVGTAHLKATATAAPTASSSSSSSAAASSSSSKQAHATKATTTTKPATSSSKQGQQQSQSGKMLTLPSAEPSAAGGAVTADTLAPATTTSAAVDVVVSSSADAAAPVYTGAAERGELAFFLLHGYA